MKLRSSQIASSPSFSAVAGHFEYVSNFNQLVNFRIVLIGGDLRVYHGLAKLVVLLLYIVEKAAHGETDRYSEENCL